MHVVPEKKIVAIARISAGDENGISAVARCLEGFPTKTDWTRESSRAITGSQVASVGSSEGLLADYDEIARESMGQLHPCHAHKHPKSSQPAKRTD